MRYNGMRKRRRPTPFVYGPFVRDVRRTYVANLTQISRTADTHLTHEPRVSNRDAGLLSCGSQSNLTHIPWRNQS